MNTDFSNEVYILIYGQNANISELRKQKSYSEVWEDIIIYLAKDDITKINDIRNNMSVKDVLDFLDKKVKTLKANNTNTRLQKRPPIGYDTSSTNDTI